MAPNDYGPTMNISLWTLTGLALAFMSLRIYAKVTRHRGLWWDDWVLIASWMATVVGVGINSKNITLGFGQKEFTNFDALETIGLLGNIGANAAMFAISWSKTSFGLTLLRVVEGKMKWLVWFIIISINVALTTMALFTWVQCDPPAKMYKTDLPGTCWDSSVSANYMIFASAYSGFMDIVLALIPWKLIWGLQLSLKEKIGVGIAMSMGMLAGIVAFVKCSVLPAVAGPNFNYNGSLVIIWVFVESTTAIIGASIPVLRVFFKEVKSSARNYYAYGTGEDGTKKTRIGNNTVIVTTKKGGARGPMDDDSDKSILDDRTNAGFGPGGIIQTQEITVDYGSSGPNDEGSGRGDGFELENLGSKGEHGHGGAGRAI